MSPASSKSIVTLLIAELKGLRCRCGRVKKPGQTFCRQCYAVLSKDQGRALYRRVGAGYEQAYEAAVRALADLRRMEVPEWMSAAAEGG